MENFVLGFFQEQLAKFIVGFRKDQVNANLLNGKGEITDVSLNCAALNDLLATVTPFVELESVHVSRLSFHVTSWSNIKKAPILIDIGDIRATIVEPLHFLDTQSGKRKKIRQISKTELDQLIAAGKHKLRGPYNLFDRIMDNITVEIKSLHVSFQPRGKFKTRRVGPWTPPKVVAIMRHVRYVSVNEYGQESSPEEVWRHNRHHHNQPMSQRAFLIYKKLSMECNLSLHPALDNQVERPPPLIKQGQVEIQIALHKRLRDAAILAVQVDATLAKVEVQVDASVVPVLAHAVAGLQYCFAKDRAFEDPLLGSNKVPPPPSEEGVEAALSESNGNVQLEGVVDDRSSVVSASLRSERSDEIEDESVDSDESDKKSDGDDKLDVQGVLEEVADELSSSDDDVEGEDQSRQPDQAVFLPAPPDRRDRPVLMLPNGIVIYEKVSFSLSLHHLTVRGTYSAKTNGYIQLVVKGLVAEFMWPKVTGEKGAYVQLSLSYVSLQERHGRRLRSIIVGGIQDESYMGPVERPSNAPRETMGDVNFPLFEDRSIREDPLGLRHSFPAQAFGLKTTVDFLDSAVGNKEDVMVLHEVGVDQFDVVLDTEAWSRALLFLLNVDGGGFDERWHSGDWIDELTAEMLVHPSQTFCFEDHIQPCKDVFLDENLLISSDLLNVTARMTNIGLRIPAAIEKDVRSCDIIVSMDEAMLLVSSALPRTFLNGKIGKSVKGDGTNDVVIEFPNDPSDVSYSMESAEDPSIRQTGSATSRAISTFRVQLTMRGQSVRVSPIIPFCNASKPQELLAPEELTLIACFEGEPPQSPDSNLTKIALFVSVLVQKMEINCDLDIVTGAISTMQHHTHVCYDVIESLQRSGILPAATPPQKNDKSPEENRIRSSFRGRRVLVRRQLQRSRETGGLSIALCLQINEFGFHLWRQNVPQSSHFRPALEGKSVKDTPIPLIQLFEFQSQDLELGLEVSSTPAKRRIVWKCCLSEMVLKACDFSKECSTIQNRVAVAESDETGRVDASASEESADTNPAMVDVFVLKSGVARNVMPSVSPPTTSHQDVLLRVEEQLTSSRSLSLACEVKTDGLVDLEKVDEIECLVVLLVEALLMPTGRHQHHAPDGTTTGSFWIFPDGSVGALLGSLLKKMVSNTRKIERGVDDADDSFTDARAGDVSQLLRCFIKQLLPKDICAGLLRFSAKDLLILVPGTEDADSMEKSNSYCLFLNQASLATAYFGSSSIPESGAVIMDVFARSGKKWTDFFGDHEQGLHFTLQSQQSLHAHTAQGPTGAIGKTLLPQFESLICYRPSGMSASTGSTRLSLDGTDNLRQLFTSLSLCGSRCIDAVTSIFNVLWSLRPKHRQEDVGDSSNGVVAATNYDTSQFIAACTDASVSIRASRKFLEQIRASLSDRDLEVQSALRQKQDEVNRLRCVVFTKERDRIAALALTASQATGWLRMGGTHQSGQRTSTTTSMWRYWAVLRRSLLILFTAPGGEPVDFISLQGARLYPLAGGRTKRDVKTGFSIVEKGGITRFFVVGDGVEYEMWVREIQTVVDFHSTPLSEDGNIIDNSNRCELDGEAKPTDEKEKIIGVHSHQNADTTMSASRELPRRQHEEDHWDSARKGQKMRQKFAGTKARLGSAVQAAKQNVKAASELQRQRRSQRGEHDIHMVQTTKVSADNQSGGAPGVTYESESTNLPDTSTGFSRELSDGSVLEGTSGFDSNSARRDNEDAPAIRQEELGSPVQRKGKMFRQRFQGTKARLGSAVQSTRQNLKTAAEKQLRQRKLSEDGSEGNPVLTHMNHATLSVSTPVASHESQQFHEREKAMPNMSSVTPEPGDKCDEVDPDEKEVSIPNDLEEPADVVVIEEEDVEGTSALSGSHDDGELPGGSAARRSQIRQSVSKIGAAVITSRSNSGTAQNTNRKSLVPSRAADDGKGRFSLRRFSKSQTSSIYGEDSRDAIRMKSIRVGAGTLSTGDNGNHSHPVPLKKIGGQWIVHVRAVDVEMSGEVEHANQEEPVSSSVAEAQAVIPTPSAVMEEDVQGASIHKEPIAPVSQTMAISATHDKQIRQTFRIRVVREKLPISIPEKNDFEPILRSLADVLALHTVVSESVNRIPPLVAVTDAVADTKNRERSGTMSNSLAFQLGLSPLDNVRMTGNLLGSLIDFAPTADEYSKIELYQCDVLAEFLNSLLSCPLPLEGRAAVVRFLGIEEKVDDDDDGTLVDRGNTFGDEWGDSLEDHLCRRSSTPDKILSLYAACEAELSRAETRGLVAQTLALSVPSKASLRIEKSTQLSAPVEPSLPASISETLHTSIHQALMKVMAERDEAHAQLVAGHVLHVHELEQERKKIDRLKKQLEFAKNDTGGTSFFLGGDEIAALERERIQTYQRQLSMNSDAELISLCQQLAREISEKTSKALEVIRLKELREIDAKESNALKNELQRYKDMLAKEQSKSEEAQREAAVWKESYGELAKEKKKSED